MNTKPILFFLVAIMVTLIAWSAEKVSAEIVANILIDKAGWTIKAQNERQVEVFKIKDGKNTCYVTLNSVGSAISCIKS